MLLALLAAFGVPVLLFGMLTGMQAVERHLDRLCPGRVVPAPRAALLAALDAARVAEAAEPVLAPVPSPAGLIEQAVPA